MDDGLGPIDIEFIINNPEVMAQADAVEAKLIEVADAVQEQATAASAAISKLLAKGGFSDSQAEVDAYVASLGEIGNVGKEALSGTDALINALNADLQNGVITAAQYGEEIAAIAQRQQQWTEAIAAQNAEQEAQLGLLEELKASLAEMKALQLTATDVEGLQGLNLAIQETEAEITKFLNVGKVGYDEFGQKIRETKVAVEETNAEMAKQPGLIEGLKIKLNELKAINPGILDAGALAQSNREIEQLEMQIQRASNVGRQGFDELGNAIPIEKTSKFSAALSKATDVGNIAARTVTMFTRQIVGLGVGFLSFEIGAKAIEKLIGWIKNLDYFTGRLDQAKQNMIALNEVMKDADKEAGKQIGTLEILYKTATDVTRSTQERIQAAKDLKAEYPEAFGNAKLMAILNGEESKSYQQLTIDIYAAAKARAAEAKIQDLATKQLDNDEQIRENNEIKHAKLAQAAANYKTDKNSDYSPLARAMQRQAQDPTLQIIRPGESINSAKELYDATVKAINDAANAANLKPTQDSKIAQGQVNSLMSLAAGASKAGDALKKATEELGPNLQNFDNIIKNTVQEADLQNLKKNLQIILNSLAPGDAEIAVIREKLKQVDDLIKKTYQVKADNPNAQEESLKRRAALMQEISAAEDSFNQRQMTKDQAALAAIENKYNDLKVKIAAFNRDPKNAHSQIGPNDIAKINTAENAEVDNQANLNENAYIQQDIEKKKKLYADYEAYKTKLGEDAANREFAELLKSGKDFQNYLDTIQKSTAAQDDGSDAMKQRKDQVAKDQAENLQLQKEQLEKLLEGLKSYEAQRNELTNAYQAQHLLLVQNGHEQEAGMLEQQYKQQLGQLDDANFEKIAAVKELLAGTNELTVKQVKALMSAVEADLGNATGLTEDEIKRIQKALKEAQKQIDDAAPKLMIQAGNGLQSMGDEISKVNEALGGTVRAIGEVVTDIGQMAEAYLAFVAAEKAATVAADFASIIGVVLIAIELIVKAISAIFSLFSQAHKTAVEAAKEMQAYQDSLITGQIKYNELLRDQERTQTDISKLNLLQIQQQQQALALQAQQAQADYSTLLGQIQSGGQQITGEHTEKYGGFLGIGKKTKVVQDLAGLSSADYDTLEKLYTEGKLTDSTKAWFEQLQTVKGELDDIGKSAQEAADTLNQVATGTTANDIANSIIDGFKAGKRSAADFANDFKSLMQNAAVSVFESNYLSGKIATFYQQFADASSSGSGLTPDKIAALKAAYAKVISDAGTQFDNLEKVVGVISGSQQNSATLTGQIQGITADQATELDGAINGLRLTNLLTNEILTGQTQTMQDQLSELRTQTLLQMQIAANTKRSADNSDAMVGSLKSIDSNTSSSSLTNVLRAAGHI